MITSDEITKTLKEVDELLRIVKGDTQVDTTVRDFVACAGYALGCSLKDSGIKLDLYKGKIEVYSREKFNIIH